MRAFRRHVFLRCQNPLAALIFSGLAIVAAVQHEILAAAVGLGLLVFAAVAYGRELRSMDVGPRGLVLRRGFRSRVIPWHEVAGVALLDVPGRAGPVQTVRVVLGEGGWIDINMVAEGTIALCDAVEAGWREPGK